MDTLDIVRSPLAPETAETLARGGRVITANMRAARALQRAYAEDARLRGLRSWAAPRITDWSSWVAALFNALTPEHDEPLPELLSPMQEELLWRRALRDDAARVVSPSRLAELAAEGYALLAAFNAHDSRKAPWAAEANEDTERFLQWADAFERDCGRLSVLSSSHLEGVLRKHADALIACEAIEPELLLAGFDRLTPSQSSLLSAFADKGARWALVTPAAPAAEVRLIAATDEQSEIHACAQWVRTQLSEHPGCRIGVLAPQLASARSAIERGFRRALVPVGDASAEPYEFSLGNPLAALPNIAAALLLLTWLAKPLEGAEVSSLLVSGVLAGDSSEAALLAQADVEFRRRGWLRAELSLQAFLYHAARAPGLLPASVLNRLQNARRWALREASGKHAYAEWAERVPALLTDIGWPGNTDRSSLPFQAEQRWNSLVEETAQLGFAGDRVGWRDYIDDLRASASATLFAAESSDAPVQIVGLAEASGQSFDALWVMGMTEENWPRRGRTHPLLPPWLQRDHAMPHASPQADLALAEEQMRRVQSSAPRIVWSFARHADGIEQRPSPLLALVTSGLEAVAASDTPAVGASATVLVTDSAHAPPWPVERIAGGSEVLKRQAACGFQGFAGRLGAAPLDTEAWGLNAAERGKMLHRALEKVWSTTLVEPGAHRLHTHADLERSMYDGTIVEIVREAVTQALSSLPRGSASDSDRELWMQRFVAIEAERLSTRLLFWLEQESARAPFRVVALEKKVEDARVGELRLRLRLDRADAIAGDRLLLLDYKTAQDVSVKQWQGERPDEPQLPIYALYGHLPQTLGTDPDASPKEIGAVVFAQIRAGAANTKMHGLAEDPEAQLGQSFRTPDGQTPRHLLSDEVRVAWDASLQSLASAFLHGEAHVNPKHGSATCARCGMFALCRVRSQHDSAAMLAEDATDEENSDA